MLSEDLLSSPLLSPLPASTKSPAEVVNCDAARRDWWRQPGGAARAVSDRKRNCVVGVLSLSTRNINPGDAAAPSLPTSPLKLLPARAELTLPVKTCLISL